MRVLTVEDEPYVAEAIQILTAADLLDDKASGFGLGADDYLTQPFELQELVALRERVGEPRIIATVPGVGYRIVTGHNGGDREQSPCTQGAPALARQACATSDASSAFADRAPAPDPALQRPIPRLGVGAARGYLPSLPQQHRGST